MRARGVNLLLDLCSELHILGKLDLFQTLG